MCTCLTCICINIYYHVHIIIDMCTAIPLRLSKCAHLVNMLHECVLESVFFYVVYAISPLRAREKCMLHIHVYYV